MKYEVIFERKDYGFGPTFVSKNIDAGSMAEAEILAQEEAQKMCGIESVMKISEV